jgi:hypothetical protein
MTAVTLAVRALVVAAVDAGRKDSSRGSVPAAPGSVPAPLGSVLVVQVGTAMADAALADGAGAGAVVVVAAVTSGPPSSSCSSRSRCTVTS